MEREQILAALAQAYDDVSREYQILMAFGTQMLKDGKRETYHEVEWYANGKSCLLDGIAQAAAALGIDWDELIKRTEKEGVHP